MPIPITGVMMQYLVSCERELWFFIHKINPEQDDINIEIGREIHKKATCGGIRELSFGPVKFDFVRYKNGKACVFEVVKSSKLKEPKKWQLRYYLYLLKKEGVENVKGILKFPREKKKESVTFNENVEEEIKNKIKRINEISKLKMPPKAKRVPYCKGCAYKEFCWV